MKYNTKYHASRERKKMREKMVGLFISLILLINTSFVSNITGVKKYYNSNEFNVNVLMSDWPGGDF